MKADRRTRGVSVRRARCCSRPSCMPGSRRDVRSYPSASSCGLHSAYSPCVAADHHLTLTKHGVSALVHPFCADLTSACGAQCRACNCTPETATDTRGCMLRTRFGAYCCAHAPGRAAGGSRTRPARRGPGTRRTRPRCGSQRPRRPARRRRPSRKGTRRAGSPRARGPVRPARPLNIG